MEINVIIDFKSDLVKLMVNVYRLLKNEAVFENLF